MQDIVLKFPLTDNFLFSFVWIPGRESAYKSFFITEYTEEFISAFNMQKIRDNNEADKIEELLDAARKIQPCIEIQIPHEMNELYRTLTHYIIHHNREVALTKPLTDEIKKHILL